VPHNACSTPDICFKFFIPRKKWAEEREQNMPPHPTAKRKRKKERKALAAAAQFNDAVDAEKTVLKKRHEHRDIWVWGECKINF